MPAKIIVTLPVNKILLDGAREQFHPFEVCHQICRSAADVERLLGAKAEILFTNIVPSNIACCPDLKWVQLISAGIDHIHDTPVYQAPNIVLTTGRGLFSIAMAEYALGVMLCLARNLPKAMRFQQERRWTPNSERYHQFSGLELRGKQVGIIGYGSVGQQIARLCLAFGMSIKAVRRAQPDSEEARYVLPELRNLAQPAIDPVTILPDGLETLLATSDFVIVAAPLTVDTRGLIDTAAFQRMRETSYLINVSRGAIVDEAALCTALQTCQIAGAVLDVFSEEPLPSTSPLYACPNLIITPHISGIFSGMFDRGFAVFLENFERYRTGQPLYNTVSRLRGY